MIDTPFDPERDLVLERWVDVPPRLVWKAWTEADHLVHWFTPAPWKTAAADLVVAPGGRFNTVMENPDGEQFPSEGCYLEVVDGERLVWTDALREGYRPGGGGFMTACLTLRAERSGTRYRAMVMHATPEEKTKHEEMGFLDGWGSALDQLVAYAKENL